MNFFNIDILGIKRFVRYSTVGTITFGLDLGLLTLLIEQASWHPVIASATSFLLAISLNYILSQRYVFSGSAREVHKGFVIFIIVAGIGLAIVTLFMALFVGYFDWNYLIARIVVGIITGFWNYLFNLYINFKVAGVHTS